MSGPIDKRNRLAGEMFRYTVTKNQTVLLYWYEKQVKTLKGTEATKFLAKMDQASDESERQLIMAKVTGNFKRGNER
ncbi:hypothetical protein [Risungbinella massiliensis]|uniref:hypothetical protein n=1 Tax=Risungbinella massiliensis TaxID=1329796 RepID=UPI0005CBD693|nr:hypothetical protein [Risungbinella massiliensis]